MEGLYPLRFCSLFRRYLWGGRRLGELLGKPIGPEADYAESWEVVDHGMDQSRVAFGPLKGISLGELVRDHGRDLLGQHSPAERFPLLFKFLDCHQNLSIQVHPNDAQARRLTPPDLGKTEAWVILAAAPDSRVYAGLKRAFDRQAVAREVARGTVELCIHHFTPRVGDCLFIPAGTVHALGAGLLVAEIQQASDTTFRLFDWNRLGPDGQPRALHVDQALAVIRYDLGPVTPQTPLPTREPALSRLVACEQFILDRWQSRSPRVLPDDDRFHLIAVIRGGVRVSGDSHEEPLATGETLLLPAVRSSTTMTPVGDATVLDIYLPNRASTGDYDSVGSGLVA